MPENVSLELIDEDEIDGLDDHAADYMEEAIRDYRDKLSNERYDRLPDICKRCRWMDWHMIEGCVHDRWPVDRKWCALYAQDIRFNRPRWFWRIVLDIQYRLWDWRTRGENGKFSAPIGGHGPDDGWGEDDDPSGYGDSRIDMYYTIHS